MNQKTKNLLLILAGTIIGVLFLVFILGIKLYVIISFTISGFIIYFIANSKSLFSIYIAAIIVMFNLGLLFFSLIPTYSKEVNLNNYYKKQNNYLKIDKKDSSKKLKNNSAKLYLKRKNKENKVINLSNIDGTKKYKVFQGDSISFISRTKELDTLANVYLWDGTILRVLPQSSINISKILKKTDKLTNSETEIKVNKGGLWFNVIKTIVDDKGFNVKTDNGTLVIRGTAGLVKEKDSNTLVYSYDHIIEAINNNGENSLINKGKALKFNGNNFIKIDKYEELIREIGEKIYKDIQKEFSKLDEKYIQEYKKSLINYTKENFGWIVDNKKQISSLSKLKMQLLSLFDKKYEEKLNNYKKYNLIVNEKKVVTDIKNFKETIFVPVNNKMEEIKISVLKKLSELDKEALKSYTINIYNKLEKTKQNIDIKNIKNVLQNNEYTNKLEKLYKETLKKSNY